MGSNMNLLFGYCNADQEAESAKFHCKKTLTGLYTVQLGDCVFRVSDVLELYESKSCRWHTGSAELLVLPKIAASDSLFLSERHLEACGPPTRF